MSLNVLGKTVPWSPPEAWLSIPGFDQLAERLSALQAPTDAIEDWRYSPIATLDLAAYGALFPSVATDPSHGRVESLVGVDVDFDVIVTIENGAMVIDKLGHPAVFFDTRRNDLTGVEPDPEEPFVSIGHLISGFTHHLEVAEVEGPGPTVLIVNRVSGGEDAMSASRVHISLAPGANALVVEAREGSVGLSLPVTEVQLSKGARLEYVSSQALHPGSKELAQLSVKVEEEATVNALHLATGSSYARLRTDCDLAGSHARANFRAGYLARQHQTLEFRTFQNHLTTDTDSDLLYKGALSGNGHSIYSGLIRIEKGASRSNAFQTNRNIVLSPEAHADSVPNLEIEENDVRCSHASAVGPIDEDQLYYLESKGIPTTLAETLIVRGFFRELAASIRGINLADHIDILVSEYWKGNLDGQNQGR